MVKLIAWNITQRDAAWRELLASDADVANCQRVENAMMTLRALALNTLAAICVVGLAVIVPTPAKSQPSRTSLDFDLNDVAGVTEVGSRRERYRYARHWRYRDAKRPYRYRGYFGADPDRYFGSGPGSYECYGYDCNW